VLSHASGFQNWRSSKEPLSIHFMPGTQYRCSGEGYSYLQSVVTHLAGKVDTSDCSTFADGLEVCATDIDRYMKANLLVPFGMASSGYLWNDLFERRAARPHDRDGKALPQKRPKGQDVARYAAAGGLLTTPTEYAKFVIEVIDPAATDGFHCHAVASPKNKSGFVIMTNGDGGGFLIRDLLLGDLMKRFL
jgi:CubicO group peptidase (beta-lactamase class C family)